MAIGVNKRATIAYFKHEVSAGTAIDPAAVTDYMAVSDDFASTLDKEVLESDLVTTSIGRKKGQLGLQDTGGTFSLEFKGSAVEGDPPEYGAVLHTLMGAENVESTEYDLVAASTTTVLNVDAGEGAQFAVGQAVLVKEDLNSEGYQIRPIESIATDALTVTPALPAAPAALTNLGKCITYNVGDSGHPSGTLGFYYGNEIKEQIAGCLIENMSLEIATGQIIKASFTAKGLNNTRADGAAPHSPSYDASNGLVGLDVEAWIGGTKIDFPSCTITIGDEIAELLSAKEITGKISNRAKKRSVDVTMSQYMDDSSVANQTAFAALTDFNFVLVAGRKDASGFYVPGECICIYMPNCYFTAAPYGDEDDIMTEELEFAAHISTGLPEVYINFL